MIKNLLTSPPFFFLLFTPEDMLTDFLERQEGRVRKRERNINAREEHQLVASYAHQLDTEPTTQACTLTGN